MFARSAARSVPSRPGEAVEVEESLGVLERARRFGTSKLSLQRLVFVHELVECAHDIGYDATVAYLLPLVQNLVTDPEVLVRQSLMERFGDLAGFLIQADPEKGYEKVARALLPTAKLLLAEKANDVRQSAIDAFITLASHLRAGDCGDQVLMPVIALSQSNDDEEARSTAVQLLSSLAEALGPDLCKQFVGVQLEAFCEDQSFRVRKAAAAGFAEVARMLSCADVLRRLVPAFEKLTKDPHWGVKKAAAENLVTFALTVPVDQRQEAFQPMVNSLLKDNSRFVSCAMLQQLGYFIGALEGAEHQPVVFMTQFVAVIRQSKANPDAADMTYHCAFTFASVTRTMGSAEWPSLKPAFVTLCTDTQAKTRKAMAASIHVVAQTLGADMLEQEVLPHFEPFLQDGMLEVRMAAIKNVANILRVSQRTSIQRRLLQALQGGMGKVENWRTRHLAASQLGPICLELVPSEEATSPGAAAKEIAWRTVVPLFLQLCADSVAQVRDSAARSCAALLRAAVPELFADPGTSGVQEEGSSGCSSQLEGPHNFVKHLIRNFARARCFRGRMMFIRMCDSIVREAPLHIFTENFMRHLLRLAADPVKNVRLCWATVILPHLRKVGRLGQQRPVLAAAVRLKGVASDPEVQRVLEEAKLPEVSAEELAALPGESDLEEEICDQPSKEGETGNSSECSDVNVEVPEAEDSPSPEASRKEELPRENQELTSSPLGGSRPIPPPLVQVKSGSPSLVPSPPPASGNSPVLQPSTPPGHDAIEDELVQQVEIERDMDATFSDRRLLAEAEAQDPGSLGIVEKGHSSGYREAKPKMAEVLLPPAAEEKGLPPEQDGDEAEVPKVSEVTGEEDDAA